MGPRRGPDLPGPLWPSSPTPSPTPRREQRRSAVWTGNHRPRAWRLARSPAALLLQHFSWSSVFFATIPIAVAGPGARRVARADQPRPPQPHGWIWSASSLSIAGVAAVCLHDNRGTGTWAGRLQSPWPATGAGIALLAVFRCLGSAGSASRCSTSPCSATSASAPPASRSPSRFFGLFGFYLLDHPVLPARPGL